MSVHNTNVSMVSIIVDLVTSGKGLIPCRVLMDFTNLTHSNTSVVNDIVDKFVHHEAADNRANVGEAASGLMESQVNQLNDSIILTEEGMTLLEWVYEAALQTGKELS